MAIDPLFSRCLAVVALLAATACSTCLDARAQQGLRGALVRVVGPAESYDVRVSGASLDGARFEHVRFVGRRSPAPARRSSIASSSICAASSSIARTRR